MGIENIKTVHSMTLDQIFIHRKDLSYSGKQEDITDVSYVRKDAVISIIKDYLENWLDTYKIERLIDKIEEL